MIALAIVALLFAITLPNFALRDDAQAKEELTRILAVMQMLKDKAVLDEREFGMRFDDQGYQVLWLDDTDPQRPPRWAKIEDDGPLAAYTFPEMVAINLQIEGENLFEKEEDEVEIFEQEVDIFEDDEAPPEKIKPPQIYFLSTGEQNEFTLAIAPKNTSGEPARVFYRLRGDYAGGLKFEGPLDGDLYTDIGRQYDTLEESPQ